MLSSLSAEQANQIAMMSIKETSFDANKAMTGLQAPDVVGVTRDNEEILLSDLLNKSNLHNKWGWITTIHPHSI